MQTTSATWKSLWAAGARLETRTTIAGTVYTEMSNPVITRALTQNGLSIGNAVSAMCQFSIMTSATIPKAAEVVVEMRLTDGTTTSEWLPAGTFYIAKRQRDPVSGLLTLECYDAMRKANVIASKISLLYPWTTSGGDRIVTNNGDQLYFKVGISSGYPADPTEIVDRIAYAMGVEIDSRTSLQTGSAYRIDAPNDSVTAHDLLQLIAAQNGGNWIITPEGKLRLIPLISSSGAAGAVDDVVDVTAITGNISERITGTVTGVRYTTDDTAIILGSDTGMVIDADVGAAIASDLYDTYVGLVYQSFGLEGAIYDPAAELGDYVRAGANGEVSSVLYTETATLGALYHGSIGAPEPGEIGDEYPYIGSASGKALIAAKIYAAQAVASLNESLDQEGVFNRLTNNGAAQGIYIIDGQVYVNMTYARSGTLVLGGLNNQNGLLKVLDANGDEIGTWNNDGIALNKGTIVFPLTGGGSGNYIALNQNGIPFESYQSNQNGACRTSIHNFAISIKDEVYDSETIIDPNAVLIHDKEHNNDLFPQLHLSNDVTGNDTLLTPYGLYFRPNTPNDSYFLPDYLRVNGNMYVAGSGSFGNGASGSFTTADGKTVTVFGGVITSIA